MNSKEKKDLTYFRFLPLLLIFLAVLSYGLVIRKLGIYWDDWAYLWTKMELGYAGIVRHFSFSRPLAGQIQNLVMEITGKNPLWIQIYGLSMRVICASLLGFLFHQIWPGQYFAASVCSLHFFYLSRLYHATNCAEFRIFIPFNERPVLFISAHCPDFASFKPPNFVHRCRPHPECH